MQSHAAVETRAALPAALPGALPKATPFLLRIVSKLVLEVLPASLASMIGAMLLAHYHFAQPALLGTGMAAAGPASPEMIRLVRDEHDLIRDFLIAQQAAQKSRHATADAQSAQASDDAKLAADASLAALAERRIAGLAAANPPAARAKAVAIAAIPAAPPRSAASPGASPAAPAPLAIAGLQDNAALPAAPAHGSFVATTLAMKDHVVNATLHAVMAIGGIPSWLGRRLGHDDIDGGERQFSAAS